MSTKREQFGASARENSSSNIRASAHKENLSTDYYHERQKKSLPQGKLQSIGSTEVSQESLIKPNNRHNGIELEPLAKAGRNFSVPRGSEPFGLAAASALTSP